MKIAIGPACKAASWYWCGKDLLPGLQQHHDIKAFHKFNELEKHSFDMVIFIKTPPPNNLQVNAKKIIYLPIDYLQETNWIPKHSNFLQRCNLIAVHCDRLGPLLKPYCKRIEFVEHYNKFTLSHPANFKSKGPIIWTGMCTGVNLIDEWYNLKFRPFRLIILTNRTKKLRLKRNSNVSLVDWTPHSQRRHFEMAKAGLDIKGNSFNQQTKPPTKIQQFVASGIPAAANRDSYSWEYFHERGLNLADPNDPERWFSESYWTETRHFIPQLLQSISKASVVESYLRLIETT
jgi:hypothetical protein